MYPILGRGTASRKQKKTKVKSECKCNDFQYVTDFFYFLLFSQFITFFLNSAKNYTFSTPRINSFYYLCTQTENKRKQDGRKRQKHVPY